MISHSKWLPGGHIGFFGFFSVTQVTRNFNFNFVMPVVYDHRQTKMGFAGDGCCDDWHWWWQGYTQTHGGLGILVGPVQYGVED